VQSKNKQFFIIVLVSRLYSYISAKFLYLLLAFKLKYDALTTVL